MPTSPSTTPLQKMSSINYECDHAYSEDNFVDVRTQWCWFLVCDFRNSNKDNVNDYYFFPVIELPIAIIKVPLTSEYFYLK